MATHVFGLRMSQEAPSRARLLSAGSPLSDAALQKGPVTARLTIRREDNESLFSWMDERMPGADSELVEKAVRSIWSQYQGDAMEQCLLGTIYCIVIPDVVNVEGSDDYSLKWREFERDPTEVVLLCVLLCVMRCVLLCERHVRG